MLRCGAWWFDDLIYDLVAKDGSHGFEIDKLGVTTWHNMDLIF